MTIIDGRQVAPTMEGIRDDHRNRYIWALSKLVPESSVIDVGCGVGYGSWILANAGHKVLAIDNAKDALDYAKEYYTHERITWRQSRAETARLPKFDAIVAFEVIEHIDADGLALERFAKAAPLLLGSVPNEVVLPFGRSPNPYHFRHYTVDQIVDLLRAVGYSTVEIFGQAEKRGQHSKVSANSPAKCRNIVFRAER